MSDRLTPDEAIEHEMFQHMVGAKAFGEPPLDLSDVRPWWVRLRMWRPKVSELNLYRFVTWWMIGLIAHLTGDAAVWVAFAVVTILDGSMIVRAVRR